MAFMDSLKKILKKEFNSSVTENGALGYRTTGKALLDLNFSVTSLRSAEETDIIDKFIKAFYEDKKLSLKWLFFASDIRGGLGERRLFRVCFFYLAQNHPDIAEILLPFIPEYNRFDSLLPLLDTKISDAVVRQIKKQLDQDMQDMKEKKPISLCAKWMPSENASSAKTAYYAALLIQKLNTTKRQYRKMLSALRKYLSLVEIHMSSHNWSSIDYATVPSRANLIYKNAFLKHDMERRKLFLEKVVHGNANIHADTLFLHDIVHRYYQPDSPSYSPILREEDTSLEVLWTSLPDYVKQEGDTLCVVDGSGSMLSSIGKSSVTCLDVANAVSIYFSEHCKGQFKNRYLTFSQTPQYVFLGSASTLREKLEIARQYNEVANTNIESVFRLILQTAFQNHMTQQELPKTILILSDMEFDMATNCKINETLFSSIQKSYASYGYQLPRLVFWNICSRTKTIPICENPLGVSLVSGFSIHLMNMVLSGETDPYQSLFAQLNTDRYLPIEKALENL